MLSAERGSALHRVWWRREGGRVQVQARPDEPQGRCQALVVHHQAACNAKLHCQSPCQITHYAAESHRRVSGRSNTPHRQSHWQGAMRASHTCSFSFAEEHCAFIMTVHTCGKKEACSIGLRATPLTGPPRRPPGRRPEHPHPLSQVTPSPAYASMLSHTALGG